MPWKPVLLSGFKSETRVYILARIFLECVFTKALSPSRPAILVVTMKHVFIITSAVATVELSNPLHAMLEMAVCLCMELEKK